jgi:hypothetical protein
MDNEKLDNLYKKAEILLDNCADCFDNESNYYKLISGHLINIMKEINLARIKSITENNNKDPL